MRLESKVAIVTGGSSIWDLSTALARVAAASVSASRSSSLSASIRPRQTDIEVRSSGSLVWKYVSPQKN
jgi:hypothetical protein